MIVASNKQEDSRVYSPDRRFHNYSQSSVLTYEQVKRLDYVMDQTVPIHGRGNFPTLYVKLKELIRLVKHKLQKEHSIEIRDVILNGGAASYVLVPENSHYNDLDLIFGTDLSDEDQFDVIRDVVLDCLKEFYPKEPRQQTGDTRATRGGCCSTPPSALICGENESQSIGTSIKSGKDKKMRDEADQHKRTNKISQNCDNISREGSEDIYSKECSTKRLNEIYKKDQQPNKTVKAVEEKEEVSTTVADIHRTNCEQIINNAAASNTLMGGKSLQMPLSNCAIKEAYVHKMVKVNEDDRWSLISLGVQQSEVNCNQISGPLAGLIDLGGQCLNEKYFPALSSTTANNFNDHCCDASCKHQQQTGLGGKQATAAAAAQQVATLNCPSHHHQQQPNYHYHQSQHRPKQSPNSIELKFVDRMRRKFEFSVDSFQIILDSLIQFYDYAPKPSQRNLLNSHPSSHTVINTRPMIWGKRRCSADCCSTDCMAFSHRMESNFDGYNKVRVQRDGFSGSSNSNSNNCPHRVSGQCHHHHSAPPPSSSDNEFNSRSKTCTCVGTLNDPRSYYQFQLEANTPSLTSEASSSGCSSSSSIVSSSSSSLSSCDEDHEDLYCDVDGQSSSSASTSSLLSSSVYSSDGGMVCSGGNNSSPSSCVISDQRLLSSDNGDGITSNSKLKSKPGSRSSEKNSRKSALAAREKVIVPSKTIVSRVTDSTADEDETLMIGGACCGEHCLGPTSNCGSGGNEYDFETDGSTSCAVISENFYPTVIGRSEYGSFKEALYHLEKKLIATRSPEEIRGGGLLKYCNLLVKNYKPTNVYQIRTLERYMCSRFFIDFSDLSQQQAKLESYLANHFSDDLTLKIDYLTILYNVVQRSTVCLMNHELRLTLEMIRDMAFKMNEQKQSQLNHQLHHQQQRAGQLQGTAKIEVVAGMGQQHQNQPKQFFKDQHSKPLLVQSGVYRVKLVNYSLAKPAAAAATTASSTVTK